jgi:DNA-binding MarR family transcriptional regulator
MISKSRRDSARRHEIEEIIRSLRLVGRVHKRHSRELMHNFKITGSQLGVIRIVSRHPRISLSELSRRMYLHTSTVSAIVDRLERSGYLTRERSRADRRVVSIQLTEKGRSMAGRAPVYAFGFLMRDIESLSAGEIAGIHEALQLLLKVMRIENVDARAKRKRVPRAAAR